MRIVFIVFCIPWSLILAYFNPQERVSFTLSKLVQEKNQNLPQNIAPTVKFDSIQLEPDITVTYNYTLEDFSIKLNSAERFDKVFHEYLKTSKACSQNSVREVTKMGFKIVYAFYSMEGMLIKRIPFLITDCPPA